MTSRGGWIAAIITALAGLGTNTVQYQTNMAEMDLAQEAIRSQTSLARECLIQLAKGDP